jgi:DNA-nicking Smr family endonuclease
MARRALSEGDREAWALYAQHVAAMPGRAVPALPLPATVPVLAPSAVAPPPPVARSLASTYLEVGHQPGGVDNSTWGKLRTGKMRATRTLDLHGRTAQAAFLALQTFLHHAHADRVRVVEIITGRGAGETGGVIRRELPLWLNLPPLRPLVLAVTHPHQANVGAVRLLLRKPR